MSKRKKRAGGKNAPAEEQSTYDELQEAAIEELKPLKQKAKEIGAVAVVIWGLISAILVGVNAALLKKIASREMGADQMIDLWRVFTATAPLTISVVATVAIFQRTQGGWPALFASAGVLASAIGIANYLGLPSARGINVIDNVAKDVRPQFVITSLLGDLFNLYGWQLFLSSFILGGFLSWVWLWKLFPVVEKVPRTKKSARPNRAA